MWKPVRLEWGPGGREGFAWAQGRQDAGWPGVSAGAQTQGEACVWSASGGWGVCVCDMSRVDRWHWPEMLTDAGSGAFAGETLKPPFLR